MSTLMYIVGVLFAVAGLGSCALSDSAIQETPSMLCLVVAAVLWGGGAIVARLDKMRP